jgi:hypothetical protein
VTALVSSSLLVASAVTIFSGSIASAAATGGAGASLPYVELQAESAATNGTIIGPSYAYGQLADEASGRKAVTLQGAAKYVEFTSTATSNSIDVRYSIPDTGNGSVYNPQLSLYINGAKQTNFTLTNAYSWFYGNYPFTNAPGANPHHFYDEVHRLFGTSYPAGTKFRLQVDGEDTASSYTIDFADFENVGGALGQPAGSVSVTSKGADATGVNDATGAFNSAVAAAGAGGTVWIPQGTFKVTQHIVLNNVSVKGAGMWYSTVKGGGVGFYGNSAPSPSTNVHLADFAIVGDVQDRNDSAQVNGIGGAMSNSDVSRVWIEHTKVGAWMDGPFNAMTLTGMRIRNVTADGVNFHNGVTNSKVDNSDIRNTGDDALATWAEINADAFDTFSNNTVQYPILANAIAIYGGHDNTVTGNKVIDSGLTQGGGIHVAQRFSSTPLGLTTVTNNTLIRDGGLDPNWNFGIGAFWMDARDGSISGTTNVDNLLIQQSPYEAIQLIDGFSKGYTISNLNLSNVTIQGTGTFAIQEQLNGSARLTNVTATGVNGPAGQYRCGSFAITDGGGNSGWSTTTCGNVNPAPIFPPFPPTTGATLGANPSSLSFAALAVGGTSAAKTVTISNSGSSAATVSSVAVSGDYAQTNTCGTSIAAGASCTVSVTFKPTANGTRTGSLTVASNATNGTVTVGLSGTGGVAAVDLAAGKGTSASGVQQTYVAANVVDSNAATYWEAPSEPGWVQVDLGASQSVSRVVLKLPTTWGVRTQTLSILTSTDNATFGTAKASATYSFDPASANTVTITFTATTARYVRVNITANTGSTGGQVSSFEVYGS